MADRFHASPSCRHGANCSRGQIVVVAPARARGADARGRRRGLRRGAKFVDVATSTRLKRARIAARGPETLDSSPPGTATALAHAEQRGARVTLTGASAPNALDGLDPALVGKDQLPCLKEIPQIVGERTTNWCIVPCPHRAWAKLVFPDLPEDEAYEQLWRELEHVLRLDEPDPSDAWDERVATLNDSARRLTERRFDAIELEGRAPS